MKTPLFELHLELGGSMVDFAGYRLPVQYASGILAEHNAVRNAAGIFDVSHMGEFVVKGKDAVLALERLLSNRFADMSAGQVRYALMLNDNGGTVDDVLVYRTGEESFFIVVNAANKAKDAEWFRARLTGEVEFEDISDNVAEIALQGPKACAVMSRLIDPAELPDKYYRFRKDIAFCGARCLISRTGYTGEQGYEIYCAAADAPELCRALLAAGKEDGLIPAGLGARDTLRLEAGMPLYGHELSETMPAAEAGLGFAVKTDKPEFIGKEAYLACRHEYRRCFAEATGRGIVREGAPIYSGSEQVGVCTSGTYAPTLQKSVMMLRLRVDAADKPLEAEVRGRRIPIAIVPELYRAKR